MRKKDWLHFRKNVQRDLLACSSLELLRGDLQPSFDSHQLAEAHFFPMIQPQAAIFVSRLFPERNERRLELMAEKTKCCFR